MSEQTTEKAQPMHPGETNVELCEPKRGTPRILCTTCGDEIEAWALRSIHGLAAGYRWRHVSDGSLWCVPDPRVVRPYDEYDASRALSTPPGQTGGAR